MIYAYDSNDAKIHILDVEDGHEYHCKVCNDRLIPIKKDPQSQYYRHMTNNKCLFNQIWDV